MKRKFISFLVIMCMLCSLCVSATAAETTYINVSYESCRVGGTFDVKISGNYENEDMACMVFSPKFDHSVLTLENITCDYPVGTFLYNENPENPKFIWYNTENCPVAAETIFTMTFKVNEDAADGVYPITLEYNENDICKENGELVVLQVGAGQVTIFHYVTGDSDNDLSITGADVVYLARYLVDMETEINLQAVDVNKDGLVDGRDLVKLARHVIGMEMIENLY